MNDELFLKRFRLFRTLVVGAARGDLSKWCSSYGNICTITECKDVETLDLEQHPHLLLLFIDEDLQQAQECIQQLKRLSYWQMLIFCRNPADPSTM